MTNIQLLEKENFNLPKLEDRYKSENDADVRIRYLIIILFLKNYPVAKIAEILLLPKHQIYYWLKKYKTHGSGALQKKERTGRPQKINKKYLIECLNRAPEEFGYKEKFWDLKTITDLISTKFDVHIHKNYVYQLLKQINWDVKGNRALMKKFEETYRPRTASGKIVRPEHVFMMKKVAQMVNAPIDEIVTQGGIFPKLKLTSTSESVTILEGETEDGFLSIKFVKNIQAHPK